MPSRHQIRICIIWNSDFGQLTSHWHVNSTVSFCSVAKTVLAKFGLANGSFYFGDARLDPQMSLQYYGIPNKSYIYIQNARLIDNTNSSEIEINIYDSAGLFLRTQAFSVKNGTKWSNLRPTLTLNEQKHIRLFYHGMEITDDIIISNKPKLVAICVPN